MSRSRRTRDWLATALCVVAAACASAPEPAAFDPTREATELRSEIATRRERIAEMIAQPRGANDTPLSEDESFRTLADELAALERQLSTLEAQRFEPRNQPAADGPEQSP